MEVQRQAFMEKFNSFIQPYSCNDHSKNPTFVCIDSKCTQRGLICSTCLTIKGKHKNHDSIEISEFMENCEQKLKTKNEANCMSHIAKIDASFEELLRLLTDFHEHYSNIIKTFISQRSKQHAQKSAQLFNDNCFSALKQCSFKSFQEINNCIKILIAQAIQQQEVKKPNHVRIEQSQEYLKNLTQQIFFMKNSLGKFKQQLKASLGNKKETSVSLQNPKFIQTPQYIYLGQTNKIQPEGKGLKYLKNTKTIYYGNFYEDSLQGIGELYTQSGDYYIGKFEKDLKHGLGKYVWANEKNLYQGNFAYGKRNGKGTFIWGDGSYYCGQFEDGQQSGYGILYRQGQKIEYQGQWKNGMYHGSGVQYFQNGEVYRGPFKEDKFHGEGVLEKAKQTIYGVWKDNQLIKINNTSRKSQ